MRRLVPALVAGVALLGCQSDTGPGGSAARLSVVRFGAGISGLTVSVRSLSDDQVSVTLRNDPEDPNLTVTTTRHDVFVEEVAIRYDARGGVPPAPLASGLSLRIPPRSEVTATVVVVSAGQKVEPPLRGLREPATMTAFVRFRGRDGMGERVEAEGSLNITFLP